MTNKIACKFQRNINEETINFYQVVIFLAEVLGYVVIYVHHSLIVNYRVLGIKHQACLK